MLTKLKAVVNGPDPQVLEALSYLLQEAQAGRITGLAYVALKPGLDFTANVVGDARKSPVLALGLASSLALEVGKLVNAP